MLGKQTNPIHYSNTPILQYYRGGENEKHRSA